VGSKVLLNAFDSSGNRGSPFPNLALMKLAAWYKSMGDEVCLVGKNLVRTTPISNPDIVYVSVIFEESAAQAQGLRWMYPQAEFHIGGSGINLHRNLPPEAEALDPDYEIYDGRGIAGWPYALGFSSRGCGRKCKFCVVPRKEGKLRQEITLERIVGGRDRLVLLDNNMAMDPQVEEKLKWLAEWGGKVNINQGFDARVVDRRPRLAELLVDVKYCSRTFKTKMLTLAYDHPRYKDIVTRVCGLLTDAGHNIRSDIQWYVLVNFNTTFEQDLARVHHLKELGTNPFMMIYNKRTAPLKLKRLARWCNRREFFWSVTWEEFLANHK